MCMCAYTKIFSYVKVTRLVSKLAHRDIKTTEITCHKSLVIELLNDLMSINIREHIRMIQSKTRIHNKNLICIKRIHYRGANGYKLVGWTHIHNLTR